jgi:putative DNA primase/helicase
MAGARLITASEPEVQATWAESQIKELTGNERKLSGRHPYGQPFHFAPEFKIEVVGNHAPKLRGPSPAMERRLRVLPFKHEPKLPNPNLKDELKAEYPAILRLMIDGCVAWQQNGLGTAAAIATATNTYFEQQDAFRRWMDERCKLHESLKLKPSILLADFNAWAKSNGEETLNGNAFAELIDRTTGLKRTKLHGVRLVEGIGLNSTVSDESDD